MSLRGGVEHRIGHCLVRSGDGVPGVEVHKNGEDHLVFLTEAHYLVSVTKAVKVELAGVLLAEGLDRDLQSQFADNIVELPLCHCCLTLHLLFKDGLLVVPVAMWGWLRQASLGTCNRGRLTPAMRGIFSWRGQGAHIYCQRGQWGCWLPPPPCAAQVC